MSKLHTIHTHAEGHHFISTIGKVDFFQVLQKKNEAVDGPEANFRAGFGKGLYKVNVGGIYLFPLP